MPPFQWGAAVEAVLQRLEAQEQAERKGVFVERPEAAPKPPAPATRLKYRISRLKGVTKQRAHRNL